MLRLKIFDKQTGESWVEHIKNNEAIIGRLPDCDVVLPSGNVSKRHARIYKKNGKWIIEDLDSTNGTFLNRIKLKIPKILKDGDTITIARFRLVTQIALPKKAESDETEDVSQPLKTTPITLDKSDDIPEDRMNEYREVLKIAHDALLEYLDLKRLNVHQMGDEGLRERTKKAIDDVIEHMEQNGEIPEWIKIDILKKDIINETLGLGPLEDFMADDSITEIMVNNAKQIYIEKNGKVILTNKTFSSDKTVLSVIERIVAPIGRRIDESSPMVDARLKDGSRVNVIIPPLAIKGPCITIRKFRKKNFTGKELVKMKTMTKGMHEFLKVCVVHKKNIIVSGGTGSGKTTLLNVLSLFVPENERIITIEDSAELRLTQEHVVSLEARPPNIEGKGEITIRDLVKNSLRMRPDRIIVGECRSGEALDMLQAMNTGHEGSMTTLHANSPQDAISRLETMCLMAGMEIPIKAIREQIASAIDIIVQQKRFPGGERKIVKISELTGIEDDKIILQDIFYFKQDGYDKDGKVIGRFVATGFIPQFYHDLAERGIKVNMNIFRVE